MQFSLSEEEYLIQDTARKLAEDRIAPLAEELDQGGGREAFLANLKLLAENGFMGLNISPDHGGTGAGSVALVTICSTAAYTTYRAKNAKTLAICPK